MTRALEFGKSKPASVKKDSMPQNSASPQAAMASCAVVVVTTTAEQLAEPSAKPSPSNTAQPPPQDSIEPRPAGCGIFFPPLQIHLPCRAEHIARRSLSWKSVSLRGARLFNHLRHLPLRAWQSETRQRVVCLAEANGRLRSETAPSLLYFKHC